MSYNACADLIVDKLYLAGEWVAAGLYQEIETGRAIRLDVDGCLPATHNGRVGAYACVPVTWGGRRGALLCHSDFEQVEHALPEGMPADRAPADLCA